MSTRLPGALSMTANDALEWLRGLPQELMRAGRECVARLLHEAESGGLLCWIEG